jgi:hypothetical protein
MAVAPSSTWRKAPQAKWRCACRSRRRGHRSPRPGCRGRKTSTASRVVRAASSASAPRWLRARVAPGLSWRLHECALSTSKLERAQGVRSHPSGSGRVKQSTPRRAWTAIHMQIDRQACGKSAAAERRAGDRPAACPRGSAVTPKLRGGRIHLVKYLPRGVLHDFARRDAGFRCE